MAKSPFIESIRADLRARRYSLQTEKTYPFWLPNGESDSACNAIP